MKNKKLLILFIVLFIGIDMIILGYFDPINTNIFTSQPSITKDSVIEKDSTEETVEEIITLSLASLIADSSVKSNSILNDVLAFNNDTNLKFQTTFMGGHCSEGTLKKYLKKTDYGYIINLNSNSPVTAPTLFNDTLYVSGGFGSRAYYSFDCKTGELVWATNLSDDGPSSAVCNDSMMFFNTESCTIFALNRRTGEMKWAKWLGDPLLTTPMIANNCVYTSYPSATAYTNTSLTSKYKNVKPSNPFACLDLDSGNIKWQKWLDGDVMVAPIFSENHIYLTTFPGSLYKLDAKTGDILASASISATSPPAVREGKVFITKRSDEGGKVKEAIAVLEASDLNFIKEFNSVDAPYLDAEIQAKSKMKSIAIKLDAANGFGSVPVTAGSKAASKNIGQANVSTLQLFQPSTITVLNNKLYNLMGNTVYCTNPFTGSVVWKHEIPGDMNMNGGTMATSPIYSSNHTVIVTYDGVVKVLGLQDGELAYEFDLKKHVRIPPIMSQGKLYIPTTEGEIICLDTKMPELTGWNMFMKNNEHSTCGPVL